jgi:hypothetical protein
VGFLTWTKNAYTFQGNDGKDYTLSPLDMEQWGSFVSWVQWKSYRDALNAELPNEYCEEIKQECVSGLVEEIVPPDDWDTKEECPEDLLEKRKFPISFTSTVVQRALESIDGIGKLVRISLSTKHPEFKTKSLAGVVDLLDYAKIQEAIYKLNGLITPEDEEEKNS